MTERKRNRKIITSHLKDFKDNASGVKLIINGQPVSADVQIINGSSYVPLRVVSESLGANVTWDGATKTISISNGAAISADNSKISLSEFNRILNGMTYEEVKAIIGDEGKLQSHSNGGSGEYTYDIKSYEWEGNAEFSSASLMFENGKVTNKSQFGLK